MSSVLVAGPESADGIVFLHGASFNAAMWQPQLEGLQGEYRCIAADLPGHGELRRTPFTLDAAVETVRTVIDDQAGGRAAVVGHGLGAYVGMAVAAGHPAAVAALVAAGAGAGFSSGSVRRNRMRAGLMPHVGPMLRRPANKLLRRITSPEVTAAVRSRGYSFHGAGQAWRDLAGRDFEAILRRYDGPVLVLLGARDTPNVAAAPGFIADVPGAMMHVLRGAGHTCNLSQPDAFNAAVRQFVRGSGGR